MVTVKVYTFSPRMRPFHFATVLMASLACASAQTTWDGGNSGSWNLDENWSDGAPTGATVARFSDAPSDAAVNITVEAGAVVHQMSFSNTGARS